MNSSRMKNRRRQIKFSKKKVLNQQRLTITFISLKPTSRDIIQKNVNDVEKLLVTVILLDIGCMFIKLRKGVRENILSQMNYL